MNKKKLKLHKVNIVKLTHLTKILGGSENSETTYTTTGNDDSNTQGATNGSIVNCHTCGENNGCQSLTNDTENSNQTVPTFNQTIQPEP